MGWEVGEGWCAEFNAAAAAAAAHYSSPTPVRCGGDRAVCAHSEAIYEYSAMKWKIKMRHV